MHTGHGHENVDVINPDPQSRRNRNGPVAMATALAIGSYPVQVQARNHNLIIDVRESKAHQRAGPGRKGNCTSCSKTSVRGR